MTASSTNVSKSKRVANFMRSGTQNIGDVKRAHVLPGISLIELDIARDVPTTKWKVGLRFGDRVSDQRVRPVDKEVTEPNLTKLTVGIIAERDWSTLIGHFDEVQRSNARPKSERLLDRVPNEAIG
jgi:hypothetical protein